MIEISLAYIIFLAAAFLIALSMFAAKLVDRADFFSPIVFMSLLLVLAYVIRPYIYYLYPGEAGVFSVYFWPDRYSSYIYLFVLSFCGIALLILGYMSSPLDRQRVMSAPAGMFSQERAFLVGALGILIGIVSFSYLLANNINDMLQSIFFNRGIRQSLMEKWQGNGLLFFFIVNLGVFYLFLLYGLIGRKVNFLHIFLLSLCFIIISLIYSIVGARQHLLGFFLMCFLFFHRNVRKIGVAFQLVIGVAMFVLAGLLGIMLSAEKAGVDANFLEQLVIRVSMTFDQSELWAAYMQRSGTIFFGQTFFEDVFLTYLPRSLFDWKPVIYGVVRLQNEVLPHLYEVSGLRATFPIGFFGELYANFHVPGIVFGSYFYGVMVRALHERDLAGDRVYQILMILFVSSGVGLVRSVGSTITMLLLWFVILKVLFATPLRGRAFARQERHVRV